MWTSRRLEATVLVLLRVDILSILPVVQCFGLIYEHKFEALGMSTVAISFLIHINNGVASILGMGQGILYPSTSLAINSHFKVRRSLAVGLSVAATSFGPVLSPYAVNALLFNYGTSGTVLLLGGVALHSLAGGMLLQPPPRASTAEDATKEKLLEMKNRSDCSQKKQETNDSVIKSPTPLKPLMQISEHQTLVDELKGKGHIPIAKKTCTRVVKALDLDLLKDPIYVNIAMGMGISIASEFNFHMLLPFILVDMADLDKPTLATVMSVQAGADITARIVSPLLANWFHWNARFAYLASLLGSMVGRTVLAHFHHDCKIILIQAIIVGIFKGLKAVFQALVLPNYVPLDKLPAASGLYMILNGILSMICGPLIGYVRDTSDSYVNALYATSGLSLFCVFSWGAEHLYVHFSKWKHMGIEESTA
ncbi:Monocarboxylate transporter 2 [Gryllus bimaculatus]|nr:Monocarboxylate transporter 2 [Gryllus bimaculatus]